MSCCTPQLIGSRLSPVPALYNHYYLRYTIWPPLGSRCDSVRRGAQLRLTAARRRVQSRPLSQEARGHVRGGQERSARCDMQSSRPGRAGARQASAAAAPPEVDSHNSQSSPAFIHGQTLHIHDGSETVIAPNRPDPRFSVSSKPYERRATWIAHTHQHSKCQRWTHQPQPEDGIALGENSARVLKRSSAE